MPKFLTLALVAAFFTLNISSAHAKPSNCGAITKVEYSNFQKLPKGSSKATLDRVLGSPSCKLSGYGNGLTAYGYRLTYDAKNWLVVVYQNGKQYKAGVLPVGMGLREG